MPLSGGSHPLTVRALLRSIRVDAILALVRGNAGRLLTGMSFIISSVNGLGLLPCGRRG